MEDIYIIEQYINGELEGEALDNFKKRLENDADFAADVKISQQLHQSVTQKNIDFLTVLEKADKDYHTTSEALKDKPKPLPRRSFLRPLLAAASVLLLLGIAWWLMRPSPTIDTIYAKNFYKMSTSMGGEDDGALKRRLFRAYKKMEKEKLDDALSDFKGILTENPNDTIKGHAMFFKALIELKNDDLVTCKKTLNEIIEGGGYNKDKAEALLKDVKKISE